MWLPVAALSCSQDQYSVPASAAGHGSAIHASRANRVTRFMGGSFQKGPQYVRRERRATRNPPYPWGDPRHARKPYSRHPSLLPPTGASTTRTIWRPEGHLHATTAGAACQAQSRLETGPPNGRAMPWVLPRLGVRPWNGPSSRRLSCGRRPFSPACLWMASRQMRRRAALCLRAQARQEFDANGPDGRHGT
jgi:hypothetical protein